MKLNRCLFAISFCVLSSVSIAQVTFDYKSILKPTLLSNFDSKTDSLSQFTFSKPTELSKQNYSHFYQAHLGAFCKLENDVLKSSNIPVRMRLGSTEYVDELEQKTPAYRTIDK